MHASRRITRMSIEQRHPGSPTSRRFEVTLADLPPTLREELASLANTASVWSLPATLSSPTAIERFHYLLTVDTDGGPLSVNIDEAAASPALHRLIHLIIDSAR